MIYIQSVLEKLIFLSIFMAPFDAISISSIAMMRTGFFLPTIVGVVIFVMTIFLSKYKRYIHLDSVTKLWLIWLLYTLVTIFVNLNNIIGAEFKGRYAELRAINIYMIFLFIMMMTIYYSNIIITKQNVINWVYKAIKYSFILVAIYSIIQLMAIFNIDFAINMVNILQPYISNQSENVEVGVIYRITGVSLEASTFSNYITVIFPWLIIGTFYLEKNNIFMKIFILLALLFTILSYSRTGYILLLLEILLIIFWLDKIKSRRFYFKLIIVLFIISSIIILYFLLNDDNIIVAQIMGVFMSFSDDTSLARLYSNLTRLGLQYAALNMFSQNILFGVGIGQFQFNVIDYLPVWSYIAPEIQGVMDEGDTAYFYGTFNTHFRVLAETGIIGFLIWLGIALEGLKNFLFVIKHISKEKKNIIKLITVSYIMSFLGFFNFDTYLFFFYWLLIILGKVLVVKVKNER